MAKKYTYWGNTYWSLVAAGGTALGLGALSYLFNSVFSEAVGVEGIRQMVDRFVGQVKSGLRGADTPSGIVDRLATHARDDQVLGEGLQYLIDTHPDPAAVKNAIRGHPKASSALRESPAESFQKLRMVVA